MSMKLAEIKIDKDKAEDYVFIREQLIQNNFKLNKDYPQYIMPVSETSIIKYVEKDFILYVQEKT